MENRGLLIVAILIFVGLVVGAWYFSGERELSRLPPPSPEESKPPPLPEAEPAPPPAPAPAPQPEIRHPIKRPEPEAAKPLPPLENSDAAAQNALGGLIGMDTLKRFFNVDSLIRRIVVTVDNLPREKLPERYNVAKPVEGRFLVAGKDDNIAMNFENYRRYAPYVRLAEAVNTKKLVAVYKRFYPLLQEEYRNLAPPSSYFNDRVVDAIDNMLAAPEQKGVVKLVQPKVFYLFADPGLEDLSAGQKIMLRMGPENAARVKAKLKEIRQEIATVR